MTKLDKPTNGPERDSVSDVDSYLAGVPEPAHSTLQKVRQAIRAAVPEAEEGISYQMPAFKYRGRFLVSYAAFKNHCSFFPVTESMWSILKEEIEAAKAFKTGKGTLQFPHDRPVPGPLVKKLVRMRIKDMEAR